MMAEKRSHDPVKVNYTTGIDDQKTYDQMREYLAARERVQHGIPTPASTATDEELEQWYADCRRHESDVHLIQSYVDSNSVSHISHVVPEYSDAGIDPADKKLLKAMLALGAIGRDTRKTRDAIAAKNDPLDTGEIIAQRMASLVKSKFCESKAGKGGGYWLLPKGIAAAKR